MPEMVRPLSAARGRRGPRLGNVNGIGLTLMPTTRTDRDGRFFAIRWVWFLFWPVIPLGRYYVSEGLSFRWGNSEFGGERTSYALHGVTRLKAVEVIGTYVWFWLVAPVAVFLPSVGFLLVMQWIGTNPMDHASMNIGWWMLFFGSLIAMVIWPVLALAWIMPLYGRYCEEWAPVHEVRWTTDRPTDHPIDG